MEEKKEILDPKTSDGSDKGATDGKTSFTPEEVQTQLNDLAGKVRAEVQAKAEAKLKQTLKEHEEALKKEREEATRMATLSQEEKDREALKKEKEALAQDRKSLVIERNRLSAEKELVKLNLSPDLVEIVLDEDPDKMMDKISKLATQVKDGVSKGVEEATKGSAPKDFGKDPLKKQEKPAVKVAW
jgi:hypothetical protein